jgi:hypothetical protein
MDPVHLSSKHKPRAGSSSRACGARHDQEIQQITSRNDEVIGSRTTIESESLVECRIKVYLWDETWGSHNGEGFRALNACLELCILGLSRG